MILATGYLNNAFVLKWLQNLWSLRSESSSMAGSAKLAHTLTENLAITSQTKAVFSTTANLLQPTHVLMLLSPGEVLGALRLSHLRTVSPFVL